MLFEMNACLSRGFAIVVEVLGGARRMNSKPSGLALVLLLLLAASKLWAQGPPYQTDDPVPVDLHHYEFYIFSGVDGTPAEIDSTGPAFEFNWGAIPRVQLHAILPWGGVFPSNNPVYLPGGTGPSAFGLNDMELGMKLAIIKETKHIPQIGTFTMFEMTRGLASEKSGTNFQSGFKRTPASGSSMGVAAIRWYRKSTIAIFPTPVG
jgi:hypothetical protein